MSQVALPLPRSVVEPVAVVDVLVVMVVVALVVVVVVVVVVVLVVDVAVWFRASTPPSQQAPLQPRFDSVLAQMESLRAVPAQCEAVRHEQVRARVAWRSWTVCAR